MNIGRVRTTIKGARDEYS